jgi:hypothetical protein
VRIDYFIYYRIDAAREAELKAALLTMQASLRAATGIAGRTRRRVDDALTWMEIYEGVGDQRQFELELGRHVMRHGLQDFLQADGSRHMERFRVP